MIVNDADWDEYTRRNKDAYRCYEFLHGKVLQLKARTVLEVGCNVGNNLKNMITNIDEVYGIDSNEKALQIGRARYPFVKFENANAKNLPFQDNKFDFVFSRGMLIHIPKQDLKQVLKELVRVSKKYILTLEYHNEEDGLPVHWENGGDYCWYRNMKENWKNYKVRILEDFPMPLELDEDNVQWCLVEKV